MLHFLFLTKQYISSINKITIIKERKTINSTLSLILTITKSVGSSGLKPKSLNYSILYNN